MMWRSFIILLILLQGFLPVQGQRPGFNWDAGAEYGRIFKHSEKIAFSIPDHTYGVGVNFQYQTFGKKEWHQHHGYPLMGACIQYVNFGDPEVLGHAVALFPNITLKIADRPRWMVHFRLGSGLAWLNRPYDRLTNPDNNSIGSRLNNATSIRLVAGAPLSPRWAVFAGASFTHFSNGASQMPNLGINVPAISTGIRYTPEPLGKEQLTRWPETRRPPRRWGGQGYLAMAYKETSFPGAAKWPVYSGSAAGLFRVSKVQNLILGMEYEYHPSIFHFSRHTFSARSTQEARQDAARWMVFLANEWMFGNTGLLIQAGYYVSGQSYLVPFPLYNKLGLRYYFPPAGRPATQFFAGIYLKSHIITAEYISIGMGARIIP